MRWGAARTEVIGPQRDERAMSAQAMSAQPIPPKARTGVLGLDDILAGGLAKGRVFLLEGSPGTGKTTIALRFLMEGAKEGEKGLYVTLSETATELHAAAASHGWTL